MIQKIKTYIEESQQELKRVNWPSKNETINLTLVVIGFSLGLAAFLGLVDLLFRYLLGKFLIM